MGKKSKNSDAVGNPGSIANAMYDAQKKEITSSIVMSLCFIVAGAIVAIIGGYQFFSVQKKMAEEMAESNGYDASAWAVIAGVGILVGVIGVISIMKSFVSLGQIGSWAKEAESHASPFQAQKLNRKVAAMNQAQAMKQAAAQAQLDAQNGQKPKHGGFFKRSKDKPNKKNSDELYYKYNPQEKKQAAPPPKAKPVMEQKFDYGLDEYKKSTFADEFLKKNKRDPFAQYRKDLGIAEEAPKETPKQKPKFVTNGTPSTDNQNNAVILPPKNEAVSTPSNDVFDDFANSLLDSSKSNEDTEFTMSMFANELNKGTASTKSAAEDIKQSEASESRSDGTPEYSFDTFAEKSEDKPPQTSGFDLSLDSNDNNVSLDKSMPTFSDNLFESLSEKTPSEPEKTQPIPQEQTSEYTVSLQKEEEDATKSDLVSTSDNYNNTAYADEYQADNTPAASYELNEDNYIDDAEVIFQMGKDNKPDEYEETPSNVATDVTSPYGHHNEEDNDFFLTFGSSGSAQKSNTQFAPQSVQKQTQPSKQAQTSKPSSGFTTDFRFTGKAKPTPPSTVALDLDYKKPRVEESYDFSLFEEIESEKKAIPNKAPKTAPRTAKKRKSNDMFFDPTKNASRAQSTVTPEDDFFANYKSSESTVNKVPKERETVQQFSQAQPKKQVQPPMANRTVQRPSHVAPPVKGRPEATTSVAPTSPPQSYRIANSPMTTPPKTIMTRRNQDGTKKSFSEMYLSRNGRNATGNSDIVKNGTKAQRKYVEASQFDEWSCPQCGKVNQEYVGICACGARKPRPRRQNR